MTDAPTPREVLDALWSEMLLDACASDGPIRDADVRTAISRYRPKIEAALTRREPLDVEVLAEALVLVQSRDGWEDRTAYDDAQDIAAEYARLAEAER